MGKSSGGIRNAGKNPRKSKVDENEIKVGTGVFGENENWRITSKKSDLIGMFPKNLYSKDEAVKSFLDNINRTENKKVQKVSKPLSNIELSVQSEGQKLYDKFNIRKVTQKQIQDQIHKLASNIRNYEDALKNRKNLTEEQRMSWKTDLKRNKERKDFWNRVFNAKRYST